MRFRSYRKSKRLSLVDVADSLGVSTETIRLWESGGRVPRAVFMQKIYAWSKGQVQPNDFYDLSPAAAHDELPLFANGQAREATHERH